MSAELPGELVDSGELVGTSDWFASSGIRSGTKEPIRPSARPLAAARSWHRIRPGRFDLGPGPG